MTVSQRNPELVELLRPDFQARYEPNFANGNIASNHLQLPGLRIYCPTSAFNSVGGCVDIAQNITLTNNNVCTYSRRYLAPCVEFSGANNLSAANNAWNQIIGNEAYVNASIRGLTLSSWVYFNGVAAAIEQIISKQNGAAAANIAWSLYRNAAGNLSLTVSDGAASETVSTAATMSANTWYHVAGVVDIANSLKYVYLNGSGTSNALVLATLNNLACNVGFGARDNGAGGYTEYMDGKQSQISICVAATAGFTIKMLYDQSKAMFGV